MMCTRNVTCLQNKAWFPAKSPLRQHRRNLIPINQGLFPLALGFISMSSLEAELAKLLSCFFWHKLSWADISVLKRMAMPTSPPGSPSLNTLPEAWLLSPLRFFPLGYRRAWKTSTMLSYPSANHFMALSSPFLSLVGRRTESLPPPAHTHLPLILLETHTTIIFPLFPAQPRDSSPYLSEGKWFPDLARLFGTCFALSLILSIEHECTHTEKNKIFH